MSLKTPENVVETPEKVVKFFLGTCENPVWSDLNGLLTLQMHYGYLS